jgi:hypothetical protein
MVVAAPIRHTLAWVACAAGLLGLLTPLVQQPVGWGPRLVVAGIALCAAVRPPVALLVLLPMQAIAETLFVAVRANSIGLRYVEALTVAFLAGWALRQSTRTDRIHVDGWTHTWVQALGIAALASALIDLVIQVAEIPGEAPLALLGRFFRYDYLHSAEPITAACLFVEGLLLVTAVADTCGRHPDQRVSLLRMLVLGAAASALVNLMRLVVAAAQTGDTLRTLATLLADVRLHVNFSDVNAAGSYFCMALFIAAGFVRRQRWFGVICTALALLGLWMAGSRIALGVTIAVAAAAYGVLFSREASRKQVWRAAAISFTCVAAAALAAWLFYPKDRNVDTGYATSFRYEMAGVALKLAATQPLWGVGLGRFQELSGQYTAVPENAHNNFLQVLAELGVPALVMFLAMLARAIGRGAGAGTSRQMVTVAAVAFLITCLGGHPLLVAGAAYPFWTVVGVLAGDPSPQSRAPLARRIVIVVLVVVLVGLPFRITAAYRDSYVEHATIGFSDVWQTDGTDTRYRWAAGRAAFFVAAASRAVAVPLRASNETGVVEVRIAIDGRLADVVRVDPAAGWTRVRLLPARRTTAAKFLRIDLETRVAGTEQPVTLPLSRTTGAVMVGRPELVR